jgi:hypothetical protein
MTNLDQSVLDGFSGDIERWRHWLCRKLIWTPGVNYLVENGCAWLVDAIASYQNHKAILAPKLQEMQFWTLDVDLTKHSAVLYCTDGDTEDHIIEQQIPHTDCNLPQIRIWLERNEYNGLTAMLPGER